MSVFGFELKEIRNERQYSIPKMAGLLGLTNKSYTNVEDGVSGSRSANVQKICTCSVWTTNERNRLLSAFSNPKHYDDETHKTMQRLSGQRKQKMLNLTETGFYEIEKEIIEKHGQLKNIKEDDPLLRKLRKAAGVFEIADKPTGTTHTYLLDVPVLKKLSAKKTKKHISIYVGKSDGWFYDTIATGRTTKKDAQKLAEYFGVSLEDISL